MNQETNDMLAFDAAPQKLPQGLNVLTILTFIGCAVFGLFTLFTPLITKFGLNMMNKAVESGKELSQKQLADFEKSKAAIELAQLHMVPTMIIGLAGIILCLVGAIWMRKYKKDGYWMYVVGELAPIVAGFAVMGTAQYTGAMSYILGIGIPVLFVILYTLQLKHLTK